MIRFISIIILAAGIGAASLAQDSNEYQCTMGALTRRVAIMHETGVSVPCEVQYFKDSEASGEQQVLWRALNEEGYCEAKAAAFVAQLTEMGWDCGVTATMPNEGEAEPEADMQDDTAALAPAQEVESASNET